ncbi:MAG: hypothetical protein JWN76_2697 [Chitinophagaceae bacterium]|nr:hypothetical protein [Chitinophagaceae bacterium]
MQINRSGLGFGVLFLFFISPLFAQVNTVEFGRNRVQYKKFQWKFYQSPNFNSYFNQNGLELGKYVAQLAEAELPQIEEAVEYSLQRRGNIIIYNNYDDYKTSNLGLGIDYQNAGGVTRLVNNKLVVYFDGNHNNLRRQVRQGIARMLTDNVLFGDDLGEIASNQALLDLPKWLTDGYVSYVAEPWSTQKDDELKSAILSGDYNNFYQFAFTKPDLAGHAFWYYIAEKYKKENVTYLLYLARIYKNLNAASLKITKKKFKAVLADFMQFEQDKYFQDIKQRRDVPKGKLTVVEEVTKKDFFRFQANPNPRSNDYGVVEFKDGVYKVKLVENFDEGKILLKYGVRTNLGDINPNYPVLAWDTKGTRLLVMYWKNGSLNMFVYDILLKMKRFEQKIEGFQQIVDAGFMLDNNTLVLSAVKNGHTDIYTYKIDNGKTEQITNDIYDDLDPVFVSFPNRSGIIFSSNRPSPNAPTGDTVLPSRNRYNIFLVDFLNEGKFRQITQLTNMKFGSARYPAPYNLNHFTFVSDENGVGNRWAGFFVTERNGLDTLYYVGEDVLRNPATKELDSTLKAWRKPEPDSISYFSVYKDSTYSFPITNYQSSLLETRVAGNNGMVSEVRREGDYKFLYKLKVDSLALRRRNINARPTDYIRKQMTQQRASAGKVINYNKADSARNNAPSFQSEFQNEKLDSAAIRTNAILSAPQQQSVLSKSKLFDYRLKFNADYVLSGITNNILVNRYQPYAHGAGPIQLNNGNDVNWSFRVGISDIMEDVKVIGGFRFGTSLTDKDAFISFQNFRKRVDWGFTYYRSNVKDFSGFFGNDPNSIPEVFSNNVITNLYQVNVAYPFNEVKSLRAIVALRKDRGVIRPFIRQTGVPDDTGIALPYPDSVTKYLLTRFEYVHDNSLNPAQNIWNGLRWKIYMDINMPVGNSGNAETFNLGTDFRYYKKIYRNFIWAGRAAADLSWGNRKMLYYLGGVDGWINPKFNTQNPIAGDQTYAFQTLAVNMRGFQQNLANGNNAVVLNSEFRLPVFTTFFNKPINNAFVRNFQLIQFVDLGTAWNGKYNGIKRPGIAVSQAGTPIIVRVKAGGIGPFAGGYGFGARSTLLGYFVKFDAAWDMRGFFRGKPIYYLALGLDF